MVGMNCELDLTLPHQEEALGASRQVYGLRWWRRELVEASWNRVKAERLHIVQRVLALLL